MPSLLPSRTLKYPHRNWPSRRLVVGLAGATLLSFSACGDDGGGDGDTDGGGPGCPGCPPTCSDEVLNGDEEDIDCGGSCRGCDGSPPPTGPTCNDGLLNGDEEDIDCGGSCQTCEGTPPPTGPVSIREYFAQFMMPVERDGCTTLHRPHSQRRWSVFYPGRCAGCGMPARMSSAAFEDTLIVSWVGSAAYTGVEEPERRAYGHLSTFTFTQDTGFQQVNDFFYEGCNFDMGSVAVSPDGNVIGALCLADDDTLMGEYLNKGDADPDLQDNQKDLYLFEWTGGEVTQEPDVIVRLSQKAGGWNYGHWDLSLTNDLSHYFVEQKATGGGHETELHYAIDREDSYAKLAGAWTDGSNCGGGHTISHRITRNEEADSWSVFCSLDNRRMRWHPVPNQDYVSTVDRPDLGIEEGDKLSIVTIGEFSTWGEIGVAAGGVANMISLGGGGWLAAGMGPFDIFDGTTQRNERDERLVDQQIGFRRLPMTIKEFVENEGDYPWNWVPLDDLCAPTKGQEPRVGMAQLHNWGIGGEDSGRILLGYSPATRHAGRTDEYHVVQVDSDGTPLHDPVVLQRGGWGVDSLGSYMPGSGCVVFPHTWDDDAEQHPTSYPQHQEPVTSRSAYVKLTALCPGEDLLHKSDGACQTQPSELFEASSFASDYETECPSPRG